MIRLVKKITAYLALAALLLPTLMLVAPSGARAADTLPDVTITQPLNNSFVSNASMIQIEGTATDDVGIVQVSVLVKNITTLKYWDTSQWVSSETWLSASYNSATKKWGGYTVPTVANGNQYQITARAEDTDSNTVTTIVNLIGDNEAPVTIIDTPTNKAHAKNVDIVGTASDNLSGISKVEVKAVGDTNWMPVVGTTKWSYSAVFPKSVAEGAEYTLEFRATDKSVAANVEPTTKTITLIKDTKAPVVGATHYPASNTVDYDSAVVFRGVSEPGALMTLLIDSDPIEQKTIAVSSGEWRFEVPASQIGAGQHDVTITATDAAGNSLQMHFTFSVAEEVVTTVTEPVSTQQTLAVAGSAASAQSQTVGSANSKKADEFKEDVEKTAEGIIKAAETEEDNGTSPWQTVVTVIAILIIAIGVGTVGYYGYEWWATKEQMAINNAVAALEEKSETTVAKKTNGSKKNGTSKKKTSRKTGRRSSSRW